MEPRRLVMVIQRCDYCNKKTNKILLLPNEHLLGIIYCSKHKKEVRKDMYNYCVKTNTYPSIHLINWLEENGISSKINVMRSNGNIEIDVGWKIYSKQNIIYNSRINDYLIPVYLDTQELCKNIRLKDLIKLNKIDISWEILSKQISNGLNLYCKV